MKIRGIGFLPVDIHSQAGSLCHIQNGRNLATRSLIRDREGLPSRSQRCGILEWSIGRLRFLSVGLGSSKMQVETETPNSRTSLVASFPENRELVVGDSARGNERSSRKRPWFQFSLFSMLLFPALVSSFCFGWTSHQRQLYQNFLSESNELIELNGQLKLQMQFEDLSRGGRMLELQARAFKAEQDRMMNRYRNELQRPMGILSELDKSNKFGF